MDNNSDGFNNPFQANQNNNNFAPSNRRKQSLWWIPVVTILGFFGVIVIAFFSFFAFLTYSVEKFSSGFESKPVVISQNSILKLDFSDLSEVNAENPFNIFSNKSPKSTFYQVIEGIREAANDARIVGIYYEGASSLSSVMAKELQVALTDFKKSEKFIYAYLETATKGQYYTALVADTIFIPDEGIYEFTGFGVSTIFPKGLYDRIGVEFTVVQCEDFKTAAESYQNKRFSDSSRLAYKTLIAQRENEFINAVAERRGLSREKIIECLKKGIIDADGMLELKLADVKAPRQTVLAFLAGRCENLLSRNSNSNDNNNDNSNNENSNEIMKNKIMKSQFFATVNTDDVDNINNNEKNKNENSNEDADNETCDCSRCMDFADNLISINDYVQSIKNSKVVRKNTDAIAIISGEGAIVSTATTSAFSQETSIVSSEFVKLIRRAKNDKNVKGIIVRINSPGGSVIASEEIYQAILDARSVKPVYASMSNVAASGGYYMAMACDTIIAHPNTITGSIGVVAAMPNLNKLLRNLHITVDTISNGIGDPFFLDPLLPHKQEDKIKFEKYASSIYKRFLTKAAQSRNMSIEQMRSVAKGRVWTGKDAFDNGLVDILGDFQTAIDMMKTRIGKAEDDVVALKFMPDEEDRWKAFLRLFDNVSILEVVDVITSRISNSNKHELANSLMIPQAIQKQLTYLQTLATISEKEKVLMALPNLIEIK